MEIKQLNNQLIRPNQVIFVYIKQDSYGFYLNFLMVDQDQCSKGFFFGVKVGKANLECES